MALGNIERGRKKFADCAQTYSLVSMHCRQTTTRPTASITITAAFARALQTMEQSGKPICASARAAA